MTFEFKELDSLKGAVLAATPELLDPNFHQTLVFIVEHGAEGTLGLVMNRPLEKKLGEVSDAAELPKALRDVPVLQGGPVKPMGLLLARFQRGASDEELSCQIFADPQEIDKTPQPGSWVRAFAGHSGWDVGQLEGELGQRAWNICPPHIALLEEPGAPALWQAFIGKDQRWRTLRPLLPKNRELN